MAEGHYNRNDGLAFEFQKRWNEYITSSAEGSFDDQFPMGSADLLDRYHNLDVYMAEKVHPSVNVGAAAHDKGMLTDHSAEHIKGVMISAAKLCDLQRLNGFEIYLLLLAIQFHDVGNMTGRDDHEKKIRSIMNAISQEIPIENTYKTMIIGIAGAHGGKLASDSSNKDTISQLEKEVSVGNIKIRPQVLAAVLRLADELSEDSTRSPFLEGSIPPQNEVYHRYAKALDPFSISGDTITLDFTMTYDQTREKYGKGDEKVYLYDEILLRTAKIMREMEYCKKYADGVLKPATTSVNITIISTATDPAKMSEETKLSYRLSLHGYPDEKQATLKTYLVCDAPLGTPAKMKYTTGEKLRNALKSKH